MASSLGGGRVCARDDGLCEGPCGGGKAIVGVRRPCGCGGWRCGQRAQGRPSAGGGAGAAALAAVAGERRRVRCARGARRRRGRGRRGSPRAWPPQCGRSWHRASRSGPRARRGWRRSRPPRRPCSPTGSYRASSCFRASTNCRRGVASALGARRRRHGRGRVEAGPIAASTRASTAPVLPRAPQPLAKSRSRAGFTRAEAAPSAPGAAARGASWAPPKRTSIRRFATSAPMTASGTNPPVRAVAGSASTAPSCCPG